MRFRSVWRFWLIGVLMGALPLKGFALAAMLACCPVVPAQAPSSATGISVAAHAHDAGAPMAGGHAHGAMTDDTAAADDASAATDSAHASHLWPSGGDRPAAKAPLCCTAASMPPPAPLMFAPAATTAPPPALADGLYRSAPLPGIEHPPKARAA